MASGEAQEKEPTPSSPSMSNRSAWKETILIPTILAGTVGAGVGLLSRHRQVKGVGSIPAMYAANLAIVTGCYCGAREFVRETRTSKPYDLLNSVGGGIMSGALLGRLQGGQLGAARYAILFAAAGTSIDFAVLQMKPTYQKYKEQILSSWKPPSEWKMPEWSPIQILDEEALAKKRARERQMYEERVLGKLTKEES